jgi:NADPH:quinone reductase-like Zn-dependent oxidoreductase
MRENVAALLSRPFGRLSVEAVPYVAPARGQLVIRTRAFAVNPLDLIKQATGDFSFRWLPYPSVLGEDVAGEVVETGEGVIRFRPGDRVVGYSVGMEKVGDHVAEGGFQRFVVLREGLTSPIPADMPFEDAAVLPLGVSTAASALFGASQLRLRHPGNGAPANRAAVVVWGASTSVGSNAVQLAVAAGYMVIATASPKNFERARRLGAAYVFDYKSTTVVRDIATALHGTVVAGVLAVGTGSAEPAVDVAIMTGAKRVSLASPSVSLLELPRRKGMSPLSIRLTTKLAARYVVLQIRSRVHGVRTRFVWGSRLMEDDVGPMLWERFLPAALADGSYTPTPAPQIVGIGLEHVQTALDLLDLGVSARKLVVTIPEEDS